jgi:mutator protein MutT
MEKIILPIVIGVVVNDAGQVLMGKRNQPQYPNSHGKWNLLGGRIEYGETPEQAVVREIKEESGLEIEVVSMVPRIFTRFHTKADGSERQIFPVSYLCRVIGGELHNPVQDPGVSELRFFDHTTLNPAELIEETELTIIQLALEK